MKEDWDPSLELFCLEARIGSTPPARFAQFFDPCSLRIIPIDAASLAAKCWHHARVGHQHAEGDVAEAIFRLQKVQLKISALAACKQVVGRCSFEEPKARIRRELGSDALEGNLQITLVAQWSHELVWCCCW